MRTRENEQTPAQAAVIRRALARRRAKERGEEVTTMRIKRSTHDQLKERQHELGASSLDEALATVLWRQRSYEAIARLKADPEALAEYQHEARELAEADVEVRD